MLKLVELRYIKTYRFHILRFFFLQNEVVQFKTSIFVFVCKGNLPFCIVASDQAEGDQVKNKSSNESKQISKPRKISNFAFAQRLLNAIHVFDYSFSHNVLSIHKYTILANLACLSI